MTSQHPAIAYLKSLFEDGDFIFFFLIHSTKKHTDRSGNLVADTKLLPLMPLFQAASQEVMDLLTRFETDGWNVYVCMNPFPQGTTERKERLVQTVRNLFVESDGKEGDGIIRVDEAVGKKLIPLPDSVLQSSLGKHHIVWNVEGISPSEAKSLLKALAKICGGDPASTDLHRVLRMPGFRNLKYDNKPVCELDDMYQRFGQRQTRDAFKLEIKSSGKASGPISSEKLAVIAKLVEKNAVEAKFELKGPYEDGAGFKWLFECPWSDQHTKGTGDGAILLLEDGSLQFNCFHEHCSGRGWSDIRNLWQEKVGHQQQFGMTKGPEALIIGGKTFEERKKADADAEAGEVTPNLPEPWAEPTPIQTGLPKVMPFIPEYLPASVRTWAVDISERMSVPMDFTGICILVALAGVLCRRAFVYPKQFDKDWREALVLAGGIIAPSGRVKTPVWKTILNPIIDLDAEWNDDYKARKVIYDRMLADWRQREKAAKKNGEVFIDELPIEPIRRRLLLNNSTPEAFHKALSETQTGLLVYRDELSGWVSEMEIPSYTAERELYLVAMNGDDHFSVDRIIRGSVSSRMSISMFGGFQPSTLIEFLNQNGGGHISSGLIPRFGLLVFPDETKTPLIDRPSQEQLKQAFRRTIKRLALLGADTVQLHFDSQAQVLFNEWLQEIQDKIDQEPNDGLKSHLSKYRGLIPKLAAIFQLADLIGACPETAEIGGTVLIDRPHLEQAIALSIYLESHARRVYGCIKSPGQKTLEVLAGHLIAGELQDGFSARDVSRNGWALLSDSQTVEYSLQDFEELGWVRIIATPELRRRGRPTIRYEVNPAVLGNQNLAR